MLYVVLDTNVLLSGVFFGGVPGEIVDACVGGRIRLALTPAILTEYRRAGAVLAERYPAIESNLNSIVAFIAQFATIVDAPDIPERVSADADDEKFLACALAAHTQIVVSGDSHLLSVAGWGGIEVLTPRQFVDRYFGVDVRSHRS